MLFVFKIRIKQDRSPEEYVEDWMDKSRVIQRMEGERGTLLYRAVGDSHTLLAITEWDSKEARDRAMANLRNNPYTSTIIDHDPEFGEFFLVGEFAETEWSVIL